MHRSTIRTSRLLASAATVALAGGLFAAPAASAKPGPGVTAPAAVPSPGFAATGVHTDACDDTTEPGWVSTTTPTLTVAAVSPAARFAVWDETDNKVFDDQAQTGADGTARIQPTGLQDGRTYFWQAWPEYQPGSGKPTETCHFRVDTTAPAQPTVSSSDFPSLGTAQKYAGQTGTFTLTSADQGSGVACYQYVLNSTLSVGWNCQSPNTAAADGNLQLKPRQWGTNVLTVQAMDNAGNVSQPVSYTFYAPSNPNPPHTPGDVDGDGIPDILVPDSAGNLDVISSDATTTTPDSVIPAALAPGAAGWQNSQVAHNGWDVTHAPVDDLFAHPAGSASLYLYRNVDYGTFASGATLVSRPSACATAGCAADWSQADQVVALGSLTAAQQPSMLTVEKGNLWLFSNPGFGYRYRAVKELNSTGSWAGYDLISRGKAADGSLAVWSRNRTTGELRLHPITRQADGTYDFSALAAPANGTVVGTLPVSLYPTVGATGDNLYAVTADRHLLTFQGDTDPKDLGALR